MFPLKNNQALSNVYNKVTQVEKAMYRIPWQDNEEPNRQLKAKQCRAATKSKSIYQSVMQTLKLLRSHFIPDHLKTQRLKQGKAAVINIKETKLYYNKYNNTSESLQNNN